MGRSEELGVGTLVIFVLHDRLLHRYWRYISLLSFQVVEPLPPNPYVNN